MWPNYRDVPMINCPSDYPRDPVVVVYTDYLVIISRRRVAASPTTLKTIQLHAGGL